MSRSTKGIFRSSSMAKDYIRSRIDREIVREFREEFYPESKLRYLGLPGKELLDVLSWREFIEYVSAIEGSDDEDERQDLELTIMKNKLDNVVDVIYDNIDDILTSDINNHSLKWPYQLVNLDYCGGLINRKEDTTSNRIDSIRGLISKQQDNAFLLFITLNLRDRDDGDMDQRLKEIEDGLYPYSLRNLVDSLEEHRQLGNVGKLKIYLPVFLLNNSPKYKPVFSPPVLYQGTKQMLHFVIKYVPFTGSASGRLIIPKDYVDILNQPLFLLHEGPDLRQYDFPNVDITS